MAESEAAALRRSGARLLVVGQPPGRDVLGLRSLDPKLRTETVKLESLLGSLGPQPLLLQGGKVAVTLLQRRGEVQVRLASLETAPVRIKLGLRLPGVRSAVSLALLGDEQRLELKRQGDRLEASVSVGELLVLRLRLP